MQDDKRARVKWDNVTIAALILTTIFLWKHKPDPLFWNGPNKDTYLLGFWMMILISIVGIVRVLSRK